MCPVHERVRAGRVDRDNRPAGTAGSFDIEGDIEGAEMTELKPMPGAGVVVGVDGSTQSRAALVFAYRDAARRNAPLRVVTVYEQPTVGQVSLEASFGVYLPTRTDLAAAMRGAAEAMLDEARAELADEPSPPATEVLATPGSPARVLTEWADGAAHLVVGGRGLGGVASVLLGSVSLRCVLHARCPVTVVHPAPAPARESSAAAVPVAPALDPLLAVPLL